MHPGTFFFVPLSFQKLSRGNPVMQGMEVCLPLLFLLRYIVT
jgi:hypothetical protein